MSAIDILPPVLSALTGFISVCLTTLSIEKLGGTTGGVLASSPTTIVPFSISLAYIEWSKVQSEDQSSSQAIFHIEESQWSVPIGMLIDVLFLLYWREIPHLSFFTSRFRTIKSQLLFLIPTSFFFWFSISVSTVFLLQYIYNNYTIGPEVIGSIALSIAFLAGLFALLLRQPPSPPTKKKIPISLILLRGVAAAVSIGVAVLFSKVSSLASGIASTFPAIYSTSMISLWISHGSSSPVGAASSMMLGSVSVSIFAVSFGKIQTQIFTQYSLSLTQSLAIAAIVSYLISVLGVSLPIFGMVTYTNKVRRRREEALGLLNGSGNVVNGEGEEAKKGNMPFQEIELADHIGHQHSTQRTLISSHLSNDINSNGAVEIDDNDHHDHHHHVNISSSSHLGFSPLPSRDEGGKSGKMKNSWKADGERERNAYSPPTMNSPSSPHSQSKSPSSHSSSSSPSSSPSTPSSSSSSSPHDNKHQTFSVELKEDIEDGL